MGLHKHVAPFLLMILNIVFYTLATLVILATLIPFIRKDHWTFRVFEFPRLQKLVIVVITIILGLPLLHDGVAIQILLGLLALSGLYLAYLVFPFTLFASKSVKTVKNPENAVKILISNVFQDNTRYDKLVQRIERENPDIILLLETDLKWMHEVADCTKQYPYKIEYPQDNTYGLLFYSKIEVLEKEVRFLIKKEYPSIKAKLKLPSGAECLFFGVHPPPPSPTEKTYSTDRDHELWLIAKEVEKIDMPIIVAGDLNDVAWSFTTDRFLEISELLDPRKGRGIYATFHAKIPFLRWPLDHLFCSKHFGLVNMRRLKSINSDHFPVLIELSVPSSRQR